MTLSMRDYTAWDSTKTKWSANFNRNTKSWKRKNTKISILLLHQSTAWALKERKTREKYSSIQKASMITWKVESLRSNLNQEALDQWIICLMHPWKNSREPLLPVKISIKIRKASVPLPRIGISLKKAKARKISDLCSSSPREWLSI